MSSPNGYWRCYARPPAARAMPEIMAAAHAAGASAMFLETEVHNTRARAF